MCGERNQYVDKILNQLEHKIQNMMPIWTDQLKKCQLKLCLCFFQNGSWLSAVQRIHKGSPCVTNWKFCNTLWKKGEKTKVAEGQIFTLHTNLWRLCECFLIVQFESNFILTFLLFWTFHTMEMCHVMFHLSNLFLKVGTRLKKDFLQGQKPNYWR